MSEATSNVDVTPEPLTEEEEKFDWTTPEAITDNLALMFFMQEKLNDFTFVKQNIRDNDGIRLTTEKFRQELAGKIFGNVEIGPNSNMATWLRNFMQALGAELEETKELVPWKWWSKSKLDMPKIHEEIIDQLHFWISIALASGMTAETVRRAYQQKYAVNVQRQQKNYVARGDTAA